jgi:hypothetical protein
LFGNRTNAIAVKPPFDLILKVCGPESIYCRKAPSNVIAVLPFIPAVFEKSAVLAYEYEVRFANVEI